MNNIDEYAMSNLMCFEIKENWWNKQIAQKSKEKMKNVVD